MRADFLDRFNINLADLSSKAEKQAFTIKYNWAVILAGVFFCSYALFGSVSGSRYDTISNVGYSLILALIFLLFLLLSQNPIFKDSVTIKYKDIAIFTFFFAAMFIPSFNDLTSSLVTDQLYHAQYSQVYAVNIIPQLSSATGIINDMLFSNMIVLVNVLMGVLLLLAYYIFRNKNLYVKIILLTTLFFIFRHLSFTLNIGADPHPPFRLVPLLVSGTVLGCSNLAFKLPQFLGLIGLMWIAQRTTETKLTFFGSILFALAIGTIPSVWHVSTLVEQSIWTCVIWTSFLLALIRYPDFENFPWVRWFSLLSIVSLMRVSAFVALGPLGLFLLLYAFQSWNNPEKKFTVKKFLLVLLPILVMLPLILQSTLLGTPSSYHPGEASYIPNDSSSLSRVLYAITTGVVFKTILDAIMVPWILFFILAFGFYTHKKWAFVGNLVLVSFFAAALFVFYTISPSLWGVGRYQVEFVVPFVILGFYVFLVNAGKVHKHMAKLLSVLMIALIIYNIFMFTQIYTFNESHVKSNAPVKDTIAGLSEFSFDYSAALGEVKASGYAGSTYVNGITYGYFSEIINGYTIDEVLKTDAILYKIPWGSKNKMDKINKDNRIKIILFVDDPPYTNDIQYLKSQGWSDWKEFRDNRTGTTIYGLIRNASAS